MLRIFRGSCCTVRESISVSRIVTVMHESGERDAVGRLGLQASTLLPPCMH